MIIHIVLFKWKSGVSKREIQKVFSDLKNLKNKLEGIDDIKSGENFSKYSEGFGYGPVVLAKDKKALENYRNHPLHLEIAKQTEIMEEKSLGVDFEA